MFRFLSCKGAEDRNTKPGIAVIFEGYEMFNVS